MRSHILQGPMPTGRKRIPPAVTFFFEGAPSATRRRALELLAASPDGATEAILLAHGLSIDLLVELVRAGLATAKAERVVAGGRAMEIARVRITEAGRRALAEAFGHHEDRLPTHGYAATRAMAAFGKSWRQSE
jgi:hypothetical protein